MFTQLSFLYYVLPFALAPLVAASCYHLDRSLVVSLDYQPCNSIPGSASMCCATNRTTSPGGNAPGGAVTRDSCLSNGLCQTIWLDANNNTAYNYSRDFCSSPDWGLGCLSRDVCNGTVSKPFFYQRSEWQGLGKADERDDSLTNSFMKCRTVLRG